MRVAQQVHMACAFGKDAPAAAVRALGPIGPARREKKRGASSRPVPSWREGTKKRRMTADDAHPSEGQLFQGGEDVEATRAAEGGVLAVVEEASEPVEGAREPVVEIPSPGEEAPRMAEGLEVAGGDSPDGVSQPEVVEPLSVEEPSNIDAFISGLYASPPPTVNEEVPGHVIAAGIAFRGTSVPHRGRISAGALLLSMRRKGKFPAQGSSSSVPQEAQVISVGEETPVAKEQEVPCIQEVALLETPTQGGLVEEVSSDSEVRAEGALVVPTQGERSRWEATQPSCNPPEASGWVKPSAGKFPYV